MKWLLGITGDMDNLDTITDFFVRVGYETTYAAIGNHHCFTINVIYILALQRSLIFFGRSDDDMF